MTTFGDYDKSGANVNIEPGMYNAIIETVSIVMENGLPKLNESGKNMVDIYFKVDKETVLRRRYTIAFGANTQTKKYAAFALLLEAACGVRCGDPQQKKLTENDIATRRVRIVVTINDRGYPDVESVLPPPAPKAGQRPAPVPVEAEEDEESEAAWRGIDSAR